MKISISTHNTALLSFYLQMLLRERVQGNEAHVSLGKTLMAQIEIFPNKPEESMIYRPRSGASTLGKIPISCQLITKFVKHRPLNLVCTGQCGISSTVLLSATLRRPLSMSEHVAMSSGISFIRWCDWLTNANPFIGLCPLLEALNPAQVRFSESELQKRKITEVRIVRTSNHGGAR